MKLIDKIHSKVDKTIKYIFQVGGQMIEVSYIDNGTGKDIICVASQTMCNMKCSFCHLTDLIGDVKKIDLSAEGIKSQVDYIYEDLNLDANDRRLHISYMGSGEPFDNVFHVRISMALLNDSYDNITFGLATILPKKQWIELFNLAEFVNNQKISLKIHLSLHYTEDNERSQYMPSALDLHSSISALEFYKNITQQPVEIHYTMIKGKNDKLSNNLELIYLLRNRGIPIKFLRFNSKDSSDNIEAESKSIESFRQELEAYAIDTEYYESPGHDISASCGEFLLKDLTTNKKKAITNE